MRFTNIVGTSLIAIAATSIAYGTAYAEPAAPAPAPSQVQTQQSQAVHGTDQGVGYTTELADMGNKIVTTVTGGKFALASDKSAVTLTNDQGAVVMSYPLSAKGPNGTTVAAAVSEDGTSLTLTPKGQPISSVKNISGQDWFFSELQHASLGAAVGAVIGFLVGLLFIGIGSIPGAVLGGVIGLLVAGGQPLIDSAFAYFSGN